MPVRCACITRFDPRRMSITYNYRGLPADCDLLRAVEGDTDLAEDLLFATLLFAEPMKHPFAWRDPRSELIREIFHRRPEATTWYFYGGRMNPEHMARDVNAAIGIDRFPANELELSPAWQAVMCRRPFSEELNARGYSIRMSSPEDVASSAVFCSTIDPLEMDEHYRDRFVKLAKLYNVLADAGDVSLLFMAS